MSFSQEKFLRLAPKNRAKKLADLILDFTLEGTIESLTELRKLVGWLEELPAIPEQPTQNYLVELYTHLRQEAGLGFEQKMRQALDARSPDRDAPQGKTLPWQVMLHNIRSGFNAGSVIRTAECFGFANVILSGYTADKGNKSLQSAAMGAQDWIPTERALNPGLHFRGRKSPAPLVALETTPDAAPIAEFDWPPSGVLLLGNEELGLTPELLEMADFTVKIPMFGRKGSLNLANAFAVAAWEIRKSHGS